MLIVSDNFLDSKECELIYEDTIKNKSNLQKEYFFTEKTFDECKNSDDFLSKFIVYASNHFDLSTMIGYEFWYNFNIPPEIGSHPWHIDKDEVLFEDENKMVYPLCTIVYYPFIEKEDGGKLLFKNFEVESLQPKTNRLICFESGVEHRTEECDFKRISIAIAPWHYKVKKWIPPSAKKDKFMKLKIERNCDGCTMCCQGWLTGTAHNKMFYPGRPCHFVGTNGCTIYENRPHDPCITFKCGWLKESEVFPEWLKPNLSKVIATYRVTKNGINFFQIFECGQKIDSTILNYLILYSLQNSTNMSIQVGGGWANYGTQEFLNDLNN